MAAKTAANICESLSGAVNGAITPVAISDVPRAIS